MKKILLVMAAAALVVACKKGDDKAGTTSTTASGGDSIGVKECDDYVSKYESCIAKMPAAQKATAETGFKAQRDAFKAAAATAAGKTALATQCKSAMEGIKTMCP